MLVIHDEQLTRELEQIAEREKRPIEDILKSMIAQYPSELPRIASDIDKRGAVKRARRKVYAKATMTDEELDKNFGAFDEEGIPRLKDELQSSEPLPGSLAYAALIAERGDFYSGNPDLARQSEDILNAHFADDYLKRMRGEDVEG